MDTVNLLVEVDVATARPPRVHAHMWTWVNVPRGATRDAAQVEAELTALAMADAHPAVVMTVGARVIDWEAA